VEPIADTDYRAEREAGAGKVDVEIVIPVYNEAHVLQDNVLKLHHYLRDAFPFEWRITIADNASTDATSSVAQALAAAYPRISSMRLEEKGRGRALREAWSRSDARVVAYMDVDLSTNLEALLPLVAPLISGHSDLAVGSRLSTGSRVVRGPKREFISRMYNWILRLVLRTKFHDAQCGFKAVRTDVARMLLPSIQDNTWFFDTELLIVAERAGLRIAEVPVDWLDDPDSKVDVVQTALDDLRGVWRLARTFWFHPDGLPRARAVRPAPPAGTGGELVSFATVGLVCTGLYLVGFFILQGLVGPFWANAISLTATFFINTAANRRWTFQGRGTRSRSRAYLRALVVHLVGLLLTTGALATLLLVSSQPRLFAEAVVLTLASAVASALRFVLMPAWIFRDRVADRTADKTELTTPTPDPEIR